jgi:putative peptide zinc metalloprotease protein
VSGADEERKEECPAPLRSDLVWQDQVHRGEDVRIVKDPVTSRYFRLPAFSARVARRFDGATPVSVIAAEATAAEGLPLDPEEVRHLAARLRSLAVLDEGLQPSAIAARQKEAPGERRSLLYLKWPLIDPDRILTLLLGPLGPLVSRGFLVAAGGLVCLAAALHLAYPGRILGALELAATAGGLPWLYAATAVTITVHELAHGLTARRLGAHVHEMGFMLLYLMPAAYTDVSDAYLVPDKWGRIAIGLAGAVADLVMWATATLVLCTVDLGPPPQMLLGCVILTTGYRSVALNLNPLIRLDGYYVLTDLLEIPNLRDRSRAVLRWRLGRWLRRPAPEPAESPRDRRVLEAYGWLASAYVAALLAVTVVVLDRWLAARLGATGHLLVGAATLAAAATWLLRRRAASRTAVDRV